MKYLQVPPRIVAELAIRNVRSDCARKFHGPWTEQSVGQLRACESITQDWEIIGWANEARFLTCDYMIRHNLDWRLQ